MNVSYKAVGQVIYSDNPIVNDSETGNRDVAK